MTKWNIRQSTRSSWRGESGENRVTLLIDRDLQGKILLFHPNVNTATISVSYQDLEKFIRYEKHEYLLVEMVC